MVGWDRGSEFAGCRSSECRVSGVSRVSGFSLHWPSLIGSKIAKNLPPSRASVEINVFVALCNIRPPKYWIYELVQDLIRWRPLSN